MSRTPFTKKFGTSVIHSMTDIEKVMWLLRRADEAQMTPRAYLVALIERSNRNVEPRISYLLERDAYEMRIAYHVFRKANRQARAA